MTFVLARTHGVSDIKVCKIIVLKLACVAGGIVTAREIKFWQASGEAARRMGTFESGTLGSGISRGFAARFWRLHRTLFRADLQYRQLRRLCFYSSQERLNFMHLDFVLTLQEGSLLL